MIPFTHVLSIITLLAFTIPSQAAISLHLHKQQISSGPAPIVAELSLKRRQEHARRLIELDERAINLNMTAHKSDIEKRQQEPDYNPNQWQSSTSSNDPYAFPTQQSSAGNSYQPSNTWSSSWTSSNGNGNYPTETSAVNTNGDTNNTGNFVPNATNNDDQPITKLDAQDPTKVGTIYTIDIGVDGVQMPFHVDTGSTQTWAAHASCQRCKDNGMTVVNTPLPADCHTNNVLLQYAGGNVTGCHVNVSLTLGEDTLQNYSILAVTSVEGDTGNYGVYYSGLIGLGAEGTGQNAYPTVVSALYQQGAIQQPIVGFYLPRAVDNQESEITFGDPTTSVHADETKLVRLPRQGGAGEHYVVRMDSWDVNPNTTSQPETISQGSDVYLDTGSSAIIVPSSQLSLIYQSVYNISSSNTSATPPCESPNAGVFITFGGMKFEIPYQDLVYHNNDKSCGPLILSYDEKQAAEIDVTNIWVFGDAFLHNVYHSVNVETGEVEMFALKNWTLYNSWN